MRLVGLLFLCLTLSGCAEVVFGVIGAISSVVGIYQRHEDRDAQKDQTQELKNLKDQVKAHQEEVKKLREAK